MEYYIVNLDLSRTKENRLNETSNCFRFIFNQTIKKQLEHYKKTKEFINDNVLTKALTKQKKEEEYNYLSLINAEILNNSIHAATKEFIKRINNNDIDNIDTIKEDDFYFYTNAKKIKIDWNKNTIYINKIRSLKFKDTEETKILQKHCIENKPLKSCKVFWNKTTKCWSISLCVE